MAKIELARDLNEDVDRILEHLAQHGVENGMARVNEVIQAISVLEHNPLIGRPVSDQLSELIIGRNATGYIALYRYVVTIDTVFVLAIRSQREAGYARE